MKKVLLILFCSLIVIKLFLTLLVPVPLGYSDSLAYMEQAKTFYETSSIITAMETAKFPPLYAIVISPAYMFQDMDKVFFIIKLINSILSSLIIFPTYFLAREFLRKKTSLLLATTTAFLPFLFTVTFFPLSENLYILLLITTMYCIYASLEKKEKKWIFLAGLGTGLCLMTRTFAITLFITLILLFFYFLCTKNKEKIKKVALLLLSSILFSLPIIYQILSKIKKNGYIAEIHTASAISIYFTKVVWAFLYINYLIVALGIIGFILCIQAFLQIKKYDTKEKLFFFLVLFFSIATILLAANNSGNSPLTQYNDHRVIGRYLSTLLPFLLIIAGIAWEKTKQISKKATIFTAIYISIATPFMLFGTFFPINNTEWIGIEILKIIFGYPHIWATISITAILILLTLSFLALKRIKKNTLLFMLIIYFITISLLNTAAVIYDAQIRWQPLEEIQLGHWINENLPSDAKFIIDRDNLECFEEQINEDRTNEYDRPLGVIAYGIRGEIINKDEVLFPCTEMESYKDFTYFITTKDLGLEKVKEGETIKIYKVK